MKLSRPLTLTVAAASCALVLAACNPSQKDAAETAAKPDAAGKIAGLATDKEQVSYMIGMEMGKSLKPIKDEVDLKTVNQAMQDVINDKKLLLNDEQMAKVMQTLAAQGKKNVELEKTFLAANGKKPGVITTASGLQYQVITQGTGPKPKVEDRVSVHYVGTLLDGTEFDSSYKRKEPAQFVLGSVVPGWSEALQLMPAGSKYKLWIPSKLGYGEAGTPGGPIPPNSTLVFELELLQIAKP